MTTSFDSVEAAFTTLSDPTDPAWAEAFGFLARQPETAQLMIETFRETLEQMGVEPSGTDPAMGGPAYNLADIAKAMGIPPGELEIAVSDGAPGTDGEN